MTIRFEFSYDGGSPARAARARSPSTARSAEGRIEHTQCCIIALDGNADVGKSNGTPVSPDYENPFAFTGTIDRVVVDLTPGADATSAAARKAEDEAEIERARNEE